MTKDYAKRRRAQYSNVKHQKKPLTIVPAWGWMGVGLLLGICCTILYWQHQHPEPGTQTIVDIHEEPPSTLAQTKLVKVNPKIHTKPNREAPRPSSRFDFYTVLPNMNQTSQSPRHSASALELALQPLVGSTTEGEKASLTEDEPLMAVAEAPPLPSLSLPPLSYVIQAASFHRQEQAEALKAQLALTGFEASIQTFKMGNRETRYRVLIGPFSSKDLAYHQQQQLEQAQQLNSVVLKIKV